MIYTIENEYLVAKIKQHGAELSSLQSKSNETELIWQADEQIWGRHAPILFPIVGKLRENSYEHNGKTYEMSQHGFARNCDFNIELVRKDEIIFLLTENEETLKKYPFRFKLYISYKLIANSLSISYKVVNSNQTDLYFSIGAHPAFKCPITSKKNREDYSLIFSEEENVSTHLLKNGNFSGETELILSDSKELQLTKSIFDKDALVFKDLESNSVSLSENGVSKLTFKFEGFPYLGIWSKSQSSEFVCIEPWFGLADSSNASGKLAEKEGIINLKSDDEFNCEYSITIE